MARGDCVRLGGGVRLRGVGREGDGRAPLECRAPRPERGHCAAQEEVAGLSHGVAAGRVGRGNGVEVQEKLGFGTGRVARILEHEVRQPAPPRLGADALGPAI